MSDETVEWHTWSGMRHKFGPLILSSHGQKYDFRIAQCSRAITASVRAQENPVERDCKRCFPAVSS